MNSEERQRQFANRKLGKRDKDEAEAGADTLLYPGGGGIAIWVRRDETVPRAALRFKRRPGMETDQVDLVEAISLVTTLECGVDRVKTMMARLYDIDEKTFAGMCAAAKEVVAPRCVAFTAIRGNGPEIDGMIGPG